MTHGQHTHIDDRYDDDLDYDTLVIHTDDDGRTYALIPEDARRIEAEAADYRVATARIIEAEAVRDTRRERIVSLTLGGLALIVAIVLLG